ncbi:hypothetical protein D9M72_414520 [compost metagenome]
MRRNAESAGLPTTPVAKALESAAIPSLLTVALPGEPGLSRLVSTRCHFLRPLLSSPSNTHSVKLSMQLSFLICRLNRSGICVLPVAKGGISPNSSGASMLPFSGKPFITCR